MAHRFLAAATTASLLAMAFVGTQTAIAHAAPPAVSAPSSPLADASSAPTEAAATAIATTYDRSVTVSDDTTPTEQVTANPDGTMTLDDSAEPVRVDQNGTWVPTDLTLQAGTWVTPVATASPVRFSAGGSDVMAQVETTKGDWISETWPDGTLPAPQLSGDTATYPNVLPGVSLELTATVDGLSEVLVVANATAASNPELATLELQMPNASVSQTSNDTAVAEASDGSTVTSAPPTWWDSSQPGASAAGPGGAGEPEPLPNTTAGDAVTLDVGDVTNQALQYPLYVDPDWYPGQQSYWFTDKAYPNQSYLNGNQSAGYQSVGWANQGGITYLSRAFWQFDTAPVEGKIITNATFSVGVTYSCQSSAVQLWTYGFATQGFTWNTDPNEWNSLQGSVTPPSANGCAVSWNMPFNVQSGVAANAAANQSHIQFGLRAADESGDVTSRKHLEQSATLQISYDTVPNAPTAISFTGPSRACGSDVANAAWVNNQAQPLVVQASQSDADSGNIETIFQVSLASSLGTSAIGNDSTGYQAQGAVTDTISQGHLTNNTDYALRAESYDGTAFSPWSGWCYFHISNTPPQLPQVSSPATGTVGGMVTVTVTAPTASVRGFLAWSTPGFSESHQSTAPVAAVTPTTSYHDCAPPANLAVYVCNATGTTQISLPVTDESGAIYVASIDRAGNISSGIDADDGLATVATGVDTSANDDTAVSLADGGHVWLGDGSTSTTIADADTSTATGVAAPQHLTLGTAVQPVGLSQGGSLMTQGPQNGTDLYLTGTNPSGTPATTAGPVIDQTKNFSVSAWLAPTTATSSGHTQTAVAETGNNGPAFALQQSGGVWQFCLTTQTTNVQQCVSTTATSTNTNSAGTVAAGQFTFVTGIWDASAGQMSIVLGGDIENTQDVSVGRSPVTGDTAATGRLVVGAANSTTSNNNAWTGDITDVAVIPGVPSTRQLEGIENDGDPSI